VQESLAIKYPARPAVDSTDPNAWAPEDGAPRYRFEFALVDQRWGADGPVPWEEMTLPDLSRFIGPVSFYRTELWTGEIGYPWVATLVVVRSEAGDLRLDNILSPSFTDSTEVLASLTEAACAGSLADRVTLTRAVATLYALGQTLHHDDPQEASWGSEVQRS
jgi:hypothetical protein